MLGLQGHGSGQMYKYWKLLLSYSTGQPFALSAPRTIFTSTYLIEKRLSIRKIKYNRRRTFHRTSQQQQSQRKSLETDRLKYKFTIQHGARGHQIGIPAYTFWAMVLDPHTKKYLSKVLPNLNERTRLWNDVQRCCYKIARERELAEVQEVTG